MPIGPLLTALAPIAAQFAAGQIQRAQSQGDIARQNAYNSPAQQVARLREAGLPFAAYEKGQAGNQSSLPETNKSIGNYAATTMQMKQAKLLDAEIRLKNSEADRYGAETKYLLEGKGIDTQSTNQTSMIQLEQGMKQAQQKGYQIANDIQQRLSNNQGYKISLDNKEQEQRITNMIQSNLETGERIEGIKLDNALKSIEKSWKPTMNRAHLNGILLDNGIKMTENGLRNLELEIKQATKENVITRSAVDTAMAKLGLEQFGTNYEFNKQYQAIAEKARGLVDKPFTNLRDLGDQLGSWIFTTMSDFSRGGRMPNLPNLGDQSKTFNTYNNIKQ